MPEQTRQEQLGKRKARRAGLHYIHDLENGWLRRRCGSGFTYYSARGQRIVGKRSLERIAASAIPPAWEDVRICPSASGHLQAIYSSVSSSDANSYLQEVAEEELTAKDFRTWTASVLALRHLKPSLEKTAGRLTKRSVTNAIRETAKEMGHTNTVCRQSYIHPGLLAACETNRLSDLLRKHGESVIHKELTRDENQFLAILPALTR